MAAMNPPQPNSTSEAMPQISTAVARPDVVGYAA